MKMTNETTGKKRTFQSLAALTEYLKDRDGCPNDDAYELACTLTDSRVNLLPANRLGGRLGTGLFIYE